MRSIYFYEDDFQQIEIVPQENETHCINQAKDINSFADEHRSGEGYSEIFLRSKNTVDTYDKGITISALESCISEVLFKYDEVYTGYSPYRELCNSITAYGNDENVVLFCQTKDGIVEYIWLTLDIAKENDIVIALNMFKSINNLGSFILVDWNWSFIANLSHTEDIKSYLKNRLEKFKD